MSISIDSVIGEYQVIDVLGMGGMGEVYRAVHTKIGRVAAIKLMASSDPMFAQRFLNEARIHASLHHPNIATLYDFLQYQERPCIIMEYVEGLTLDDAIAKHGRLLLTQAIGYFRQIVDAVAYLHQHDVIHRDIKPNNIKITPDGHAKLLDFGIAKSPESKKLTSYRHFIGTASYASLEQMQGKADMRSDVWSLGVVFYEMLTGKLPFEGETLTEFWEQISRAWYVEPSLLDPSIPGTVDKIIRRCLQKHPATRYQNAGQLLTDVQQIDRGPWPLLERGPIPFLHKIQSARLIFRALAKDYWPIGLPLLATVTILISVRLNSDSNQQHSVEQLSVVQRPPLPNAGDEQNSQPTLGIHVFNGPAEVYVNEKWVGRASNGLDIKHRPGERILLELKRSRYYKCDVFEFPKMDSPRNYRLQRSSEARKCSVK